MEKVYYFDVNSKLDIIPTLEGFEVFSEAPIYLKETSFCELLPFDKNKMKEYSYEGLSVKFPSFKVFKHLELVSRITKKKRAIYYLKLTRNTISTYWKRFNMVLREVETKKRKRIVCYYNPIFGKKFMTPDYYVVDKKNYNYHKRIKDALYHLEKNHIKADPQDFDVKFLNVFILEQIKYSHQSHFHDKTTISHKTDANSAFEAIFLNVLIGTRYKTILDFQQTMEADYFSNSLAINLSTGSLYHITEKVGDNFISGIVRKNNFITNIQVSNISEKENLYLISMSLLEKLNLDSNSLDVIWLVMDSIKVMTDPSEHNALILGDVYDIGLNFMNIINKEVDRWTTVSDMI